MKHVLAFIAVLTLLAVNSYATPVNMGTAAHFGLLAGTTVTNIGSSKIKGHVGVAPGSAVTGFTPDMVDGTLYLATDAATLLAQNDLIDAYNQAAGALSPTVLTGQDLGAYNFGVLGPGVYFFSTQAQLTGDLTLDGQNNSDAQWIFQIGTELTTAPHSKVKLKNGATSSNVFWQVGSSATIGTDNDFAGNIMALTSISLNGGTLDGRALARNGAVTISAAQTVNAVPEPSGIMALGMMLTSAAVWFRRKK